jgi:hypothetical protein
MGGRGCSRMGSSRAETAAETGERVDKELPVATGRQHTNAEGLREREDNGDALKSGGDGGTGRMRDEEEEKGGGGEELDREGIYMLS